MAQAQLKPRVEKDRFTADGVRMFNVTKEHGTVYYDAAYGDCPTRFVQLYEGRETSYAADGTPVGYTPGKPLPQPVDVVEAENEALRKRIRDLEESSAKTNVMLEKLLAASEKQPPLGLTKK